MSPSSLPSPARSGGSPPLSVPAVPCRRRQPLPAGLVASPPFLLFLSVFLSAPQEPGAPRHGRPLVLRAAPDLFLPVASASRAAPAQQRLVHSPSSPPVGLPARRHGWPPPRCSETQVPSICSPSSRLSSPESFSSPLPSPSHSPERSSPSSAPLLPLHRPLSSASSSFEQRTSARCRRALTRAWVASSTKAQRLFHRLGRAHG